MSQSTTVTYINHTYTHIIYMYINNNISQNTIQQSPDPDASTKITTLTIHTYTYNIYIYIYIILLIHSYIHAHFYTHAQTNTCEHICLHVFACVCVKSTWLQCDTTYLILVSLSLHTIVLVGTCRSIIVLSCDDDCTQYL